MAESRAAELLESLARGRGTGTTTSPARHGIVGFLPVLGLVALTLLVLGWRFVSAPAPLDDRMEVVSSGDVERADEVIDSAGATVGSTVDDGGSTAGDPRGGDDGSRGGPLDDPVLAETILVHVAGAVMEPGVVRIPVGSRVVDAITAAGGMRHDADPDRLNLAARLDDGWRIVVPMTGQEVPDDLVLPDGMGTAATAQPGSGATRVGGGATGGDGEAGRVNLNTATEEELKTLPGVGPATAAAIIAKREADGPFRSVESLIEVRGIGEVKLDALRDLVTTG